MTHANTISFANSLLEKIQLGDVVNMVFVLIPVPVVHLPTSAWSLSLNNQNMVDVLVRMKASRNRRLAERIILLIGPFSTPRICVGKKRRLLLPNQSNRAYCIRYKAKRQIVQLSIGRGGSQIIVVNFVFGKLPGLV